MVDPASYVEIEALDRKIAFKARECHSYLYPMVKRVIHEDSEKKRGSCSCERPSYAQRAQHFAVMDCSEDIERFANSNGRIHKEEVERYEKEAYPSGNEGSNFRRKSTRVAEDHSWRKDWTNHGKRSNGWDTDWGPSSSTCTEEKYVPVTIKLNEAPEFMKDETGYYGRYPADLNPITRQEGSLSQRKENLSL
eukprot:6288757-Amphidinium_carterae.1